MVAVAGHNPRPGATKNYPPIPLFDGAKVIETEPDQSKLDHALHGAGVSFIKRSKGQAVSCCIWRTPWCMCAYVSDKFKANRRRLFGDVMEEVDWSVGEVLKALKDEGLEDNTLVLFTSDNGPWLIFGNHAGSAGPLRGAREPATRRGA